ncbi:MAG: HEAT repeat domain-containing protein, partial [Spirochaetaceae bacterium]|nr:HEAT repeat domain-containing protein [Spirochaetaceae bacterium]
IEALFHTRRPELADFLYSEAADPTAFHRDKAIFALGAYPGKVTEGILVSLLDDEDGGIRAAAAKSLGRIGDRGHLKKIRELWMQSQNLHERLDYMIAMMHMDPERLYLDEVFSRIIVHFGVKPERTIFTLISRQFGMSPPLGIIYREESAHEGEGLELLLEESMDTSFLLEQRQNLKELWQKNDYQKIWEMCITTLRDTDPPPELLPITRALKQFSMDLADSANALAVLYFTYQILTAEGEK